MRGSPLDIYDNQGDLVCICDGDHPVIFEWGVRFWAWGSPGSSAFATKSGATYTVTRRIPERAPLDTPTDLGQD